jgi:hypothetical protein
MDKECKSGQVDFIINTDYYPLVELFGSELKCIRVYTHTHVHKAEQDVCLKQNE